ncbi:MAG: lytic transglycosylase domain-containing protein [Patescibacteria group bacterium]
MIVEFAQEFGIHPNLYANLIKLESWTYDVSLCPDGPVTPSCTSYAGALGMAQVMYYNFGCSSPDDCEIGRDPRTNLRKGAEIFADYLARKGGDWRMGLAAYHGGPNRFPYREIDWQYADQILAWYWESENE